MKLSIIIPVFNEARTIGLVIQRAMRQPLPSRIVRREVVVVDDGSTDATSEILKKLKSEFSDNLVVLVHSVNQGKGAAIKSAVARVSGDVVLIQDADLEYDPQDYSLLLDPVVAGRADVVYGSRFTGQQAKRVLYFWHYLGNRFLTMLSNMTTNLNLTDMETGFKVFRSDVIKSVPLCSSRFGFEPEVTAKVARRGFRIYEVGIGYNGRTYGEGKKITWVDGIRAIGTILRYWVCD